MRNTEKTARIKGKPITGSFQDASRAAHTCARESKALWALIKSYPSLGLIPIALLAVLLAGGLTAVIYVKNSEVKVAKERAASEARDSATWFQQQVQLTLAPVLTMASMVQSQPQYNVVRGWFPALSESLVNNSQAAPGALIALQLVPHGVLTMVYPRSPINLRSLGTDLFNSTSTNPAAARLAMTRRRLQVLGPLRTEVGWYGLVVFMPIFVSGVDANDTFGIAVPWSSNCGAPCAYNATTRTAAWGMVVAAVDLPTISSAQQSDVRPLFALNYNYEIEALPSTSGTIGAAQPSTRPEDRFVMRSNKRPVDPVEAYIQLPDAQWVVRVAPEGGWQPGWYGGLIAAVVILSVIISLLLFAAMVAWRRHQLLLEALLPKEVIREMQVDEAVSLGARMIQTTDTPADLLLKMMGDLLQGRPPELRDVVFIRTALLRNADVYQPLNLRGRLKEANFDADVMQALMNQLGAHGAGSDGPSLCSEQLTAAGGGDCNTTGQLTGLSLSKIDAEDAAGGDSSPFFSANAATTHGAGTTVGNTGSSHAQQLKFDTLAAALAALLAPQLPLGPPPPAAPLPLLGQPSSNGPAIAGAVNTDAPSATAADARFSLVAAVGSNVPPVVDILSTGGAAVSGSHCCQNAANAGNALNLPPVPLPAEPFVIESQEVNFAAGGGWLEPALPSGQLLRNKTSNGVLTVAAGGAPAAGVLDGIAGGGSGGAGPSSTGSPGGGGLIARLAAALPLIGYNHNTHSSRERDGGDGKERRRAARETARGGGRVGDPLAAALAADEDPFGRMSDSRVGNMGAALSGAGGGGANGGPRSGSAASPPRISMPGGGALGPPVRHLTSNLAGGPVSSGARSGTLPTCQLSRGMSHATSGQHLAPAAVVVMPPPPVIEEVERLLAGADAWTYDTWKLAEATQGHALSALAFYLMHREGLISKFNIKPAVLARLLRALEAGYAPNPYHNATHAADVLQTLHVLIHASGLHVHYLDRLGLLAAYFAAIVHDHNHPGLTNDFLINTNDMLAIRYNDKSPLENHHTASCFGLMALQPELDALAPLSQPEKAAFRKQVIEMVMGTDMKQHFATLAHFNTVHRLASYSRESGSVRSSAAGGASPVAPGAKGGLGGAKTKKSLQQQPAEALPAEVAPKPLDDTERMLTLQVALKVADIGHLGEEIEVHKRWLGVLEEEFFNQGDRERALGLPISPLFDRTKQGVSKSQVGFYDFVGLPLVHAISSAFPGAKPIFACFAANYEHWKVVEQQQQQQQQAATKSPSSPVNATVTKPPLPPPSRPQLPAKQQQPQQQPPHLPTTQQAAVAGADEVVVELRSGASMSACVDASSGSASGSIAAGGKPGAPAHVSPTPRSADVTAPTGVAARKSMHTQVSRSRFAVATTPAAARTGLEADDGQLTQSSEYDV
ncbi:hypothetical protein HYH02_011675 [Chlamydomonas schloesseri]|uniref:Phosphodiesterase n=1 Tax=Chlamydomonas schloesseri TaxID=2026947 RepID=A0A835T354_9CHLO|nr:hypothetical protein HYH02_011675 [Chlamydomonas schloesseri]|eukprot:KAG2436172.1 hypothetical protein HYH02_011675 [Chlamydomonas schloesseri]